MLLPKGSLNLNLRKDSMDKDRVVQINEKLNTLKEYLGILKGFGMVTVEDLNKDPIKRGAIERYLQLSAEVVIDIAGQLIAELGFRTPNDYKESILILGEEKILPDEFAKEFSAVASFRNILVHEYLDIDYNKVVENLNHLEDFEKFSQAVAKYLR